MYDFNDMELLAELLEDAHPDGEKSKCASPADLENAKKSLAEEEEAVKAYTSRIETSTDPALKEIYEHNRKEEMEHADALRKWIEQASHAP